MSGTASTTGWAEVVPTATLATVAMARQVLNPKKPRIVAPVAVQLAVVVKEAVNQTVSPSRGNVPSSVLERMYDLATASNNLVPDVRTQHYRCQEIPR